MRKYLFNITVVTVAALAILAASCSSSGSSSGGIKPPEAKKTVNSASAGNNLTVSLASYDGTMHRGKQYFTVTFFNPAGDTVDVGSAALNFRMPPMGSMAEMNAAATLTKTDKPGVYNAVAEFSMAGDWDGQITYEGRAGNGSCMVSVVVK